jgi:uncharacterized membrane protein YphA (DoxX/SURF4 family)
MPGFAVGDATMNDIATHETHNEALVRSVWWTLRVVFGVVPLVAGLDKFFNLLVVWEKYLSPPFARLIPLSPTAFMHVVGIIEIVAGLALLFTPWTRLFSWIVAIWLWGIAIDLIAGGYYDIAVRDIVIGISATCLARLTVLLPVQAGVRTRGAVEARRTEVHA